MNDQIREEFEAWFAANKGSRKPTVLERAIMERAFEAGAQAFHTDHNAECCVCSIVGGEVQQWN